MDYRSSPGRRWALLPWLCALASGCGFDAVIGELFDGAGPPDRLAPPPDLRRADPLDLLPPPDLSLCPAGRLAFGAQLDTPTMEAYGRGPTIADFNGDGLLDAALPGGATPSGGAYALLLLGNGDGSFRVNGYATVARGYGIVDLTSADLDGDGHVDLALAVSRPLPDSGAGVLALLNDGSGFSEQAARFVSFAPGPGVPFQIATGDLNGDGKPDLVIATRPVGVGPNLFAMVGSGTGSFFPAASIVSPSDAIALADLDGDGHLDLASVEGGPRQLHLLRGDGLAGFREAASVALDPGLGTQQVVPAFLDGDDRVDLAIPDYKNGTGGVALLLNDGGWRFRQAALAALGGPVSLAAADLDGDGHVDLVGGDNQAPTVEVWGGHGDGTFGDPLVLRIGTEPIGGVAVGLIDSDCRPDLLLGRGAQFLTTVLNATR